MKNNLKVGAFFSDEYIDFLKEINLQNQNTIISEVYGSIKEDSYLTARPAYRLPKIDYKCLEDYIHKLKEININFNYTLNTTYIGSKFEFSNRRVEITNYIKLLKNIGINSYIISLPIMADIIREIDPKANIEVSTIAHIDTITQIKIWNDRYNINKVCAALYKNRDIMFLQSASSYCNANNIQLELLANEFCGNGLIKGDDTSTTHCIYRDHCYNLHSIGYTSEDNVKVSNYPMSECISSRTNPISWIKLYYIRPEDLSLYNSIGINHFKITGRTGSLDYLKMLIQAYVKESFDGNLLDLWKQLETIDSSESNHISRVYIENKKLDNFLSYWFNHKNKNCANEVCGETCRYCDIYYSENFNNMVL